MALLDVTVPFAVALIFAVWQLWSLRRDSQQSKTEPFSPKHDREPFMTPPLSARLRTETRDAHAAAERAGIMQDILRGTITRVRYVALLSNLAVIYAVLEEELDRLFALPALKFVDRAALRRTPALQADISALQEDGVALPVICDATVRYAEHLRAVGATNPGLLAAHAYLRYLGDLSGGQILARVITRALDLKPGEGTAFYEFPAIPHIDDFKRSFRDAIDHLPMNADDRDDFIAEAQRGYVFHEAMFSELA